MDGIYGYQKMVPGFMWNLEIGRSASFGRFFKKQNRDPIDGRGGYVNLVELEGIPMSTVIKRVENVLQNEEGNTIGSTNKCP